MNDQRKLSLQDMLEEEIPAAQIDVWPAVKQRLVARKHLLFQQGENMNTTRPRLFSQATLVVLMLAALLALAFVTPQGRALAHSLLQFFTRAGADALPAQPSYEGIPEAPRLLSAGAAASQAGFTVLAPSFLPEGLTFLGASYTPEINAVVQQFGYDPQDIRLSIRQQPFTTREACDLCGLVGASAPVETVQIVDFAGEYTEGVWELTDSGPVWRSDAMLKTLRWQQDGMAFEMIAMGLELAPADLIAIAEGLGR